MKEDIVVKCTIEDIPYFNAPIYLENKQQVGKVDEIFGSLRDYYISVKLSDEVKAKSFATEQKVLPLSVLHKECLLNLLFCSLQLFIDPAKLLPLQRFIPQPAGAGRVAKRGGGRGGAGGRGGFGRGGGGRGGGGGFGGRGGGGRGGGGGFGGRGGGGGGFGGRGGGGFGGGRGGGGFRGGRGRGG